MLYSLIAVLVLILDVFAIVQVLTSAAAPVEKLLWVLLILLLPVVGMILWFVLGPGRKTTVS